MATRAVVITEQADMWDLDGTAAGAHRQLRTVRRQDRRNAKNFGKPVLLINGDSHHYRSDNPLKAARRA